jgi:DNA-binding transcriptional MerR regulator
MTEQPQQLTIDELAARVGVSVRTVRFYIAEGLVPGPNARGRAAAYGDEHLLRLRLVRRLVDQHVPLSEVRSRLARLPQDDLRSLLAEEDLHSERREQVEAQASPRAFVSELLSHARAARTAPRAQQLAAPLARSSPPGPMSGHADPSSNASPAKESWRRWRLADGVELQVRADAERHHNALIRRLLDAARLRLNDEGNPNP